DALRSPRPPPVRDLVLVGGGHSHIEVLRRVAMRPIPGVRVSVIAREPETPYSGMLPGLIAGHYAFDDIHIDLEKLCRIAGARLPRDEAAALALERRRVECLPRPAVRFDLLSLDVGGVPSTADAVLGDGVFAVKPIGRLYLAWTALRER